MGDVIEFPKNNHTYQSEEQWLEEVHAKKRLYVENVVEGYGTTLLSRFALLGFDVDDDAFMYDYIFVMEMLKSTLCRNVGVDHDLYDVVRKQAAKYYTKDS